MAFPGGMWHEIALRQCSPRAFSVAEYPPGASIETNDLAVDINGDSHWSAAEGRQTQPPLPPLRYVGLKELGAEICGVCEQTESGVSGWLSKSERTRDRSFEGSREMERGPVGPERKVLRFECVGETFSAIAYSYSRRL